MKYAKKVIVDYRFTFFYKFFYPEADLGHPHEHQFYKIEKMKIEKNENAKNENAKVQWPLKGAVLVAKFLRRVEFVKCF